VTPCRICGAPTQFIGIRRGRYEPRDFRLHHCPDCRFSFVANPWTDYERIYTAAYYQGKYADPLVDYVFELDHPGETIRLYEWRGIVRAVESLCPIRPDSRWLDYGCGNGGLVRHVRERSLCQAVGFEEGWIASRARTAGIPLMDEPELSQMVGAFDVVTAIEVLEHVEQPLEMLTRIRSLLKPGGLFFFTTGNAAVARGRLASWRYVIPEIHISFFEPSTAARALAMCGFRPEFSGFLPGFTDIIRFKALKNLGIKERARWQSCVPWSVLTRLLDSRLHISGHPVGWAEGNPCV
jgi:2-polyprenyl-3-methyl-5-hydroxy-6-metoxy-1,4-benzoquinol methylase